jgi:amino acid transporter
MSTVDSTRPREGRFDGGAMGTADIVFFVLAGVAPMGVVVALLTLSIALGDGAGVPGTYLVAGVVLALFSAGYVRMSRRITSVGGFYTFARYGLGRRAGGATAYVALLAYNVATIGIFGALAYFGSEVVSDIAGTHVPWQVCALAFFLIVAVLAYFEVTLSAKVLGVALAAEVLILLGFDAAVLLQNGFHGFSLEVFKPAVVFGGGFGVSLMLAFGSFVGFEATALYGEEARAPHRTVPRATYVSLAVISGFYLVTTWAAISAYGVDHAQAAAKDDPENFVFNASTEYLGQYFTDIMGVLVMTSLFAAFLAFHCNTARYQVALARDGLLPRSMARIHPDHGSPIMASAWQLGLVAAATFGFTLAGQDPYLGMGISLYGLGVLGIVALQATASISIVGFFLRHRRGESIWGAIVAPALGGLGLATGLILMTVNYSTLTGSDLTWVNSLPWLLPAAAVAGAAAAGRQKDIEPSYQDNATIQSELAAAENARRQGK